MIRLIAAFLFLFSPPLSAHELSYPLTRTLLIEQTDAGARATVQVPALLTYADAAAARSSQSEAIEAPFLQYRAAGPGRSYVVDAGAFAKEQARASVLVLSVAPLVSGAEPEVISTRAYTNGSSAEMLVADAVFEVVLLYPKGSTLVFEQLSSVPVLHHHWFLETRITDTRHRTPRKILSVGALLRPIVLEAPRCRFFFFC